MQDISIKTQAEDVPGTDTSNDEPLMVENQTQTSNQVPEKQVESKEAKAKDVPGSEISDDEQLMVNNQTQTGAEAEKVTGVDTSDEGSVVEVILEDKTS